MCEMCRSYPCHPRCPNAEEPRKVCYCDDCKKPIYEGDDLYKILEYNICEDCVRDSMTYAEVEDE